MFEEELLPEFTGERVIEDSTPERIWLDHIARYKFAARYIQNKVVLDVACGTGFGANILKIIGALNVVGIDISRESIDYANKRYIIDGLQFMIGDILNIDFPDDSFEVIVSFETIEHVKHQDTAILEIRRVLKPQGLLIISSPNRKLTSPGKSINESPDNTFHIVEYEYNEFILFLSKYFSVNQIYGQRAVNKIFLIPFFAKILRLYLPKLYNPDHGSPLVKKSHFMNEYRYILAICTNLKK